MEKITSTLAKEANGNVQITFSIPWPMVEVAKKEALAQLAKNTEVPGFRKGKAPLKLVASKISQNTVIEKALSTLLPKALAEAIVEYKIKPAIYPKYELIKAKDNEAWQVRAVTCELPEVELGDYKKIVTGALRSKTIWTPDKGKEPSSAKVIDPEAQTRRASEGREEKEQIIIRTLLESVKLNIPAFLIEEETNSRISNLLARIEKLGLSLESYLASLGKTPETLRADYEKQTKEAIALDLILSKIADSEGLKVKEEEVEGMIKAAQADPNIKGGIDTPEQKQLIRSILKRRHALDSLIAQV